MAKRAKNTVKIQDIKTRTSKADFVDTADIGKMPSSKTGLIEVTEVDKKAPPAETLTEGQEQKPSTEMAPLITDEDRQLLRRVGATISPASKLRGRW